jgi:hypothetical protein
MYVGHGQEQVTWRMTKALLGVRTRKFICFCRSQTPPIEVRLLGQLMIIAVKTDPFSLMFQAVL